MPDRPGTTAPAMTWTVCGSTDLARIIQSQCLIPQAAAEDLAGLAAGEGRVEFITECRAFVPGRVLGKHAGRLRWQATAQPALMRWQLALLGDNPSVKGLTVVAESLRDLAVHYAVAGELGTLADDKWSTIYRIESQVREMLRVLGAPLGEGPFSLAAAQEALAQLGVAPGQDQAT
jgi:hypothetical protein